VTVPAPQQRDRSPGASTGREIRPATTCVSIPGVKERPRTRCPRLLCRPSSVTSLTRPSTPPPSLDFRCPRSRAGPDDGLHGRGEVRIRARRRLGPTQEEPALESRDSCSGTVRLGHQAGSRGAVGSWPSWPHRAGRNPNPGCDPAPGVSRTRQQWSGRSPSQGHRPTTAPRSLDPTSGQLPVPIPRPPAEPRPAKASGTGIFIGQAACPGRSFRACSPRTPNGQSAKVVRRPRARSGPRRFAHGPQAPAFTHQTRRRSRNRRPGSPIRRCLCRRT
jgi:hypothetical protein